MDFYVTSIFVNDQEQALDFYTNVLGFIKKTDRRESKHRWVTVVPPESRTGVELLLESNEYPAAKAYQEAIHEDGMPAISFRVENIMETYRSLREKGVSFLVAPKDAGPVTFAVFDDTCGNFIQISQAP